jgi:hypothetical protein
VNRPSIKTSIVKRDTVGKRCIVCCALSNAIAL